MRAVAALAALLLPALAAADQTVVFAPLSSLIETGEVGKVEGQMVAGAATVPGFKIVSGTPVTQAAAHRRELLSCEGDPACLAELGKLAGAALVIAGDVSVLSEGAIVYLKLVYVGGGVEVRSTTAVLRGDAAARTREAGAAAYRLLRPDDYVGTLELVIDVPTAAVYLDGQLLPPGATRTKVPVGEHALRVTHEEYHDYVRFVDVDFGGTTRLEVDLKAYPILRDEMREAARRMKLGPTLPRPWYREWWAVAGAGVAVATVTAVIIAVVASGYDYDVTTHLQ